MNEMAYMVMALFVVATVLLVCANIRINNRMNNMRRNFMSAELNIINAFEAILPSEIIDDAAEIVACEIESAMRSR